MPWGIFSGSKRDQPHSVNEISDEEKEEIKNFFRYLISGLHSGSFRDYMSYVESVDKINGTITLNNMGLFLVLSKYIHFNLKNLADFSIEMGNDIEEGISLVVTKGNLEGSYEIKLVNAGKLISTVEG